MNYDEIRRKAVLDNYISITIDTSKDVSGSPLYFALGTYYDWGGLGIIEWGDGIVEKLGGWQSPCQHTYTDEGIYEIKLRTETSASRVTFNVAQNAKITKIDYNNFLLDSPNTFQNCNNLTEVILRGVSRDLLEHSVRNTPMLNQDLSSWFYFVPYNFKLPILTGKSYLNYDYQWIDNILNACYDRELNGDGWGGLAKALNLQNCRRSTASDEAFNYLKFVRGWSITINVTVIT